MADLTVRLSDGNGGTSGSGGNLLRRHPRPSATNATVPQEEPRSGAQATISSLLDRRPIGDHARDIVAYVRLVAELNERVVAEGGPLDGTEIDVARGADEVAVEMADRSIHGYVRTDGARLLQSGVRGAMFRWIGRR